MNFVLHPCNKDTWKILPFVIQSKLSNASLSLRTTSTCRESWRPVSENRQSPNKRKDSLAVISQSFVQQEKSWTGWEPASVTKSLERFPNNLTPRSKLQKKAIKYEKLKGGTLPCKKDSRRSRNYWTREIKRRQITWPKFRHSKTISPIWLIYTISPMKRTMG